MRAPRAPRLDLAVRPPHRDRGRIDVR